jgi:NADPH:quinone reductase
LYQQLRLPQPWTPATSPTPLVIYGAASAIGIYAIQLAKRSNIHPIIAIAGESRDHVESFLERDRGDVVIDYRRGEAAIADGVKTALGDSPLHHAYDAVSNDQSYIILSKLLSPGAKLTVISPSNVFEGIPKTITWNRTRVGDSHLSGKDLAFVFSRYFTKGLQEGWFRGQPQVVVPGGLGGVQAALADLKAGKAHGIKYVFRIAETEGVGASPQTQLPKL